tara:strand:- start:622 stop:1599 length:978 start_codon:yes stop_codon:yes gene_type:complete
MFKNSNVLVTGGAGFIGSHIAKELHSMGANVTVIDSMNPSYGGNLFNLDGITDEIELVIGDVKEKSVLKNHVKNKDFIFSLAGQLSHLDSMIYPHEDIEINTISHLSLLEVCKKYNNNVKIIFTSTRQVYGEPSYLPVDENHPLNPPDINGISKLAAEKLYQMYYDIYDIKSVIFRLTNTYGPGQLIKNNKQGFTGIYFREAILGKDINVKGNGKLIRDFNYISDVVEAFFSVIENNDCWGQIFNLGDNQHYTISEFLEIINKFCDFNYIDDNDNYKKNKIGLGDYYGSFKKINKKTGWTPKISLLEGVNQSIKFYKKNLDRYLN